MDFFFVTNSQPAHQEGVSPTRRPRPDEGEGRRRGKSLQQRTRTSRLNGGRIERISTIAVAVAVVVDGLRPEGVRDVREREEEKKKKKRLRCKNYFRVGRDSGQEP